MPNYKGFDKNLRCREFQYEIGKEYEHEGALIVCKKGFHACENPLDVLSYYPLREGNRYCEVEQSGEMDHDCSDTKVVSRKIKIGNEIGISGIVTASVKYVQAKCKDMASQYTSGVYGNAVASGVYGNAAASGDRGNAAASGDRGNAAASGWRGNAATSGAYGNAAASGEYGNAAASVWRGNAATSGAYGNAAASGWHGNAAASGDRGNAAASGEYGNAAASGEHGNAAASGLHGNAAASGDCGTATVTGVEGSAAALGYQCLATAWGKCCKAKGALGCWLVLTEYSLQTNEIKNAAIFKVDGETIKADTWYTMKDSKPVEVQL